MELKENPLISVIIPVYNVEPYLQQCLDSAIGQTYENLEILIIDDGSTDGCGKICDEYAERDERIKVFHTDNRGLSAARNLGLDKATGEYISFIDSDDWFELNAIETVVYAAVESGADIVCFNYVREYKNYSRVNSYRGQNELTCVGEEIIHEYCTGSSIGVVTWNKIYKKELFNNIRFPEGQLFEDIATTHRLLINSNIVVCLSNCLVHYRARENGISNGHRLKHIQDQWWFCIDRYDDIINISEDNSKLLGSCISTIGRMWSWYSDFSEEEQMEAIVLLNSMREFSIIHRKEVLESPSISLLYKAICILPLTTNSLVMKVVNGFNKIRKSVFDRKKLYE